MVVFTCNHCGDSLQKPRVAKHYQFQCRKLPFLTCVDCLEDFKDDYVEHIKCKTEDQRYGGIDYIAKSNKNKGEKKQLAWINVVQNVLTNTKDLSNPERNFLNSIVKFQNIPRKKAKFLNFIKSNQGNRVNIMIVESVWDKMERAFKESNSNNIQESNTEKNLEKTNPSNFYHERDQKLDGEENSLHKNADNIKKRKHNQENVGDESAQKKFAINNEASSNNTNHEDVFSWKGTILEIISSKKEISLKKLKKKVIKKYLSEFPNACLEKSNVKFEKKLKKVSGICIEDEKVTLKKNESEV